MSDKITGADYHLANDIFDCLINDGGQAERWINQIEYLVKSRSLAGRAKRGTYDPVMASRAWRYVIEAYLPTYKRDMGIKGNVPVVTRNLAGRIAEKYYRDEVYQAAGVAEPTFPEADAALYAAERGNDWIPDVSSGNAPTLAHDLSGLAPTIGG